METPILRTLHAAPAAADLISQEQQLLWMVEHIRQLERDKTSLLEQMQAVLRANQTLSDQLQALTQRTDALERALSRQPSGSPKAGKEPAKSSVQPKSGSSDGPSSSKDSLPKSACGQSCFWSLDGGLLTIHGSGRMTDYAVASSVPWSKHRAEITAAVLSEGITSVGDMAFSYCDKLRNVRLPSTITYIGKSAFWRCTSLSEIALPDSLSAIGRSAFWRCTSLTSVQFPAGLSTLDSNAFFGCSSLHWISFLGSAPRFIGQRVFDEVAATVRYPGNNSTWNMGIQSRCGGKLTWKPTSD